MAIKIYKKEEQLKTPMFYKDEYGEYFVNENGERIATIILYKEGGKSTFCKGSLKHEGYRTDFAEWDDDGCLVRFLEEIV